MRAVLSKQNRKRLATDAAGIKKRCASEMDDNFLNLNNIKNNKRELKLPSSEAFVYD